MSVLSTTEAANICALTLMGHSYAAVEMVTYWIPINCHALVIIKQTLTEKTKVTLYMYFYGMTACIPYSWKLSREITFANGGK